MIIIEYFLKLLLRSFWLRTGHVFEDRESENAFENAKLQKKYGELSTREVITTSSGELSDMHQHIIQ